jgi:hypothetical protein
MGVIFTVDYQAGFAKVRGSQKVIVALQSALKCHCAPLGNSFLLRLLNTDSDNIIAAYDTIVVTVWIMATALPQIFIDLAQPVLVESERTKEWEKWQSKNARRPDRQRKSEKRRVNGGAKKPASPANQNSQENRRFLSKSLLPRRLQPIRSFSKVWGFENTSAQTLPHQKYSSGSLHSSRAFWIAVPGGEFGEPISNADGYLVFVSGAAFRESLLYFYLETLLILIFLFTASFAISPISFSTTSF